MTQIVNISPGHTNVPASTAEAFANAGGDWVVTDSEILVADAYGELATGPYSAADHAATSGLDVTIDSLEAVVGGAVLAKDTQTTVTLASDTDNQTVYLGWDTSQQDAVLIGLDSAFASGLPKTAIWEFDTDSSTVTNSTDLRPLGRANARTALSYSKSDADGRFVSKSGGGLNDDLNFQGNSALNVAIDPRSDRPSSPSLNQAILRTDTTPRRIEVNTSVGWRVAELSRVYPPIDDFEDGEFASEYTEVGGGFSGTASVTSSAARSGTYGLELHDFARIVSMPGDGLENYPSAGVPFRAHINPQELGDAEQYWIYFGRQDYPDGSDGYSAEFISGDSSNDNGFRIRKNSGSTTTTLDSDFDMPSYSSDRWYRLVFDWRSDGFDVSVVDTTGSESTLTTLTTTDTEFQSGGIGYRSSASSRVFVDDLELI